MKMYNLFCISLIACGFLCACSGGNSGRTPETIRAEKILRVAMAEDAREIEYHVARKLAESLSAQTEIAIFTGEELLDAVENDFADVGLGGIVQGSIRRSKLVETTGYANNRFYVLTRRGEAYPSETAMSGYTILSNSDNYLNIAEHVEIEAGIAGLLDKSADAVICDRDAALSAVAQSGEKLQTELLTGGYEFEYVAVAAKKNEKLFAHIDNELGRLVTEGLMYGIF